MSYDFKENLVITKQLSKLCYTAVAKMPHQYLKWETKFDRVN